MQLLVARGHEGLRGLDGERVLLDLFRPVVQGVLQGERGPHDAVGGHRRRRVEAAQTHLRWMLLLSFNRHIRANICGLTFNGDNSKVVVVALDSPSLAHLTTYLPTPNSCTSRELTRSEAFTISG